MQNIIQSFVQVMWAHNFFESIVPQKFDNNLVKVSIKLNVSELS
jgi:hypothetical protein